MQTSLIMPEMSQTGGDLIFSIAIIAPYCRRGFVVVIMGLHSYDVIPLGRPSRHGRRCAQSLLTTIRTAMSGIINRHVDHPGGDPIHAIIRLVEIFNL